MNSAPSSGWFGGHRIATEVASLSPPIDVGSSPLASPAARNSRPERGKAPRRTRGYYAAADRNRLTAGFQNQLRMGPDRPLLTDAATIRARIYQLERDNPVMDAAIRAHVSGVLPTEILVEANATRRREDVAGEKINRAWNNPVQSLWDRWCAGPLDFSAWASHAETMATIQRKIVRAVKTDGEVFVVKRRRASGPGLPKLQIEVVEAERLGTSLVGTRSTLFDSTRPGVEYDATGRPVSYTFAKSSNALYGEYETIAAKDVLHIFLPHRPGAQTGKMPLASSLMSFFFLGQTVDAELKTMNLLSRISGIVTNDDMLGEEDQEAESEDQQAYRLANVEDATIIRSSVDGTFTAFQSNRPAAAFGESVKTFIRWIASGTGTPFSLIAANYDGLNYTVSRREMMGWMPYLRIWREDIVTGQFLRFVYEEFVDAVILEGIVTPPFNLGIEDLREAKYRAPRTEYMDPQTEVQADILAVQGGMMSPQDACAARGVSFYEVIDQISEAMEYAKSKGVNHLAIFSAPAGVAKPGAPASQANNAVPPPIVASNGGIENVA